MPLDYPYLAQGAVTESYGALRISWPVRRSLPPARSCMTGCGRHLANLFTNGNHGVDETIQLGQRFALGRLDHQRAGHRKAQRRRWKSMG